MPKGLFFFFVILFSTILFGCGGRLGHSNNASKRVLIVHAYTSHSEYCAESRRLFSKAFMGRDVELVHLYSDVPEVDYWQSIEHFVHQMQHWQKVDSLPDLVILHGDESIDRYFASLYPGGWSMENQWEHIPVVYTGAICLDSIGTITEHPSVPRTGFCDTIDWQANLDLANRLWPGRPAVFELDFYRRDSLVKELLCQTIRENDRYLDNTDFQYPFEGVNTARFPQFKGKQQVNIISFREKFTNQQGVEFKDTLLSDEQRQRADSMLYVMLHNAKYTCPIQTKLDIYSNRLIDHSMMPQVSCVNAQFVYNNVLRVLGGYFVDLQTQVNDAASYAIRILDGVDPASLPVRHSHAELHLDWRAMQQAGLEYDDWSGEADIQNAPLRVSHPVLWMILLLLCFILAAVVVSGFIMLILKLLHSSSFVKSMRNLRDQMEWVLKGNESAIWQVTPDRIIFEAGMLFFDEVKTYSHEHFINLFNPDDHKVLRHLLETDADEGRRSYRVRYISPEGEKWLELVCDTYITNGKKEKHVLILNVDKQKRDEDDILYSLQKSEETNLKQSFLASLTHDLRSPLASIVSMAGMIASGEDKMTEEERYQFVDLIKQNTDILLTLLDDASNTSRMQIGEYRFMRNDVDVKNMIESVYHTYKVMIPEHIDFSIDADRDCYINVDRARTIQVINNFVSNAIKATAEGSIRLGWQIDADEVRLFVRDTGCGIDAESQKHLFEKYFKADGKTAGAGLGLSICQTMVDKQDGRIEVESQVGKGSTFSAIFRRVSVLVAVVAGLFMTSCNRHQLSKRDDGKPFEVTVLHSYDSLQYVYTEFNHALASAFLDKNVAVHLRHVYLDNDDYQYHDQANQMTRDILLKHECDLIICEGTPATDRLMDQAELLYQEHDNTITLPIPVVAGNVNAPFWDRIRKFRNLRVWTSGLDPRPILPLIGKLTVGNVVEVELDYSDYDENLRRELSTFLVDAPYMDQLRMTDMRVLKPQNQKALFGDSLIILGISAAQPEMNGVNDPAQIMEEYNGQYEEFTNILLNYSVNYPQLVVKKDLWGRELASRNRRPQYTLVPYDFGSYNTPYLAGYFASMTTVAHDVVETCVHVLMHDFNEARFSGRHQRQMWMDYRAMSVYDLEYDDFKDNWTIVNVPLRLRQPWAFYGFPVLFLLLFVLLCYFLVTHYYTKRHQRLLKMQRSIGEGRLSLLGTDIYFLHVSQTGQIRLESSDQKHVVMRFNTLHGMVKSENEHLEDTFYDNLNVPGFYNLEIPLTLDEGKSFHWWRMTYQVSEVEAGAPCVANGVIINIDSRVARNKKLAMTRQQLTESERREKFLNNLNHEIRSPLNIILGFSELLATREFSLSSQEQIKISQDIRLNSERLLSQVQNILDYSRLESGRMNFNLQPVQLDSEVLPILEELKYQVEHPAPEDEERYAKHLSMSIIQGRKGLCVLADIKYVKRIFEQLISNAVKFTPSGEIVAGWTYDIQHGRVKLFVEDCGVGMSSQTARNIFTDFYKMDSLGVGIGLGLSISKAMVKGMDGQITVNSAPNLGTRVSFYLKLAPERQDLRSNS